MKVAIVGSRTFNDYEKFRTSFPCIFSSITEIVSGGAIGADTLAEKYARENNIKLKVFLPKFKTDKNVPYHPKWFFERNREIVDYADVIYAFWDGKSRGTNDTISYAKRKGKPVTIIRI